MKDINQKYTIDAPLKKVWQALTDATLMKEWTGGPASMDLAKGGKFSLWGGDIHGRNTNIVPNKLLEQDWFSNSNGTDQMYKVSFKLTADGDKTDIEVLQAVVPDDEIKDYVEGWRDYYFEPIKALLEA